MRKGNWLIAAMCLFALMFTTAPMAFAKGKVLVISREFKKHPQALARTKGIKEVLGAAGAQVEFFYMGVGKVAAQELPAKAEAAKAKIAEYKPDVIIISGNESMAFVGKDVTDVPVLFVHLLGDVTKYVRENVSGLFQKTYNMDIFALCNQFFGAKTIAIFGSAEKRVDAFLGGMKKKKDLLKKKTGVEITAFEQAATFDEWKEKIKSVKADVIYLGPRDGILDGGKVVPKKELTVWTTQNAPVPCVSGGPRAAKDGALFSITLSIYRGGVEVAEMAVEILNGKNVSEMPAKPIEKGALHINTKTAQRLGIDIPFDVLEVAEKVYE